MFEIESNLQSKVHHKLKIEVLQRYVIKVSYSSRGSMKKKKKVIWGNEIIS